MQRDKTKADSVHKETLIVHPTTAEQSGILKAVIKALKIKFEVATAEKSYDQDFVAKIQKSREDYQSGKGTPMTIEELNKLWK